MIGGGDELLVALAHLERERALRGLRQQLVRVEPPADLAREPEPVEPAGGEHDRVEPSLGALAQPRVDVAAQRLDRERRLEREQLRLAPRRRRADAHPRPDRVGAAQRVARIVALEVRADDEAVRIGRGHVLGRVHGDVDAAARAAPPRAP